MIGSVGGWHSGIVKSVIALGEGDFAHQRVAEALDLVADAIAAGACGGVVIVAAGQHGHGEGEDDCRGGAVQKGAHVWFTRQVRWIGQRLIVAQMPSFGLPPAVSWDAGSSRTMASVLSPRR